LSEVGQNSQGNKRGNKRGHFYNIEILYKIVSDVWTEYKGLDNRGKEHENQNCKVKDGDEIILPNVYRNSLTVK